MENSDKLQQSISPIHWKRSDPAPEEEMQAYWKKLRNFYRTGEIFHAPQKPASSALLSLLDDSPSPYPFSMGNSAEKTTIELEEKAPFYLVDFLLTQHQKENRKSFKIQLATLIKGLNRLMHIDDKNSDIETLKGDYDFANELIAFDKMVDMVPQDASEKLSDSRLSRLTDIIDILQKGLVHFNKQEGVIGIEKELKTLIEKEFLFKKALLVEAKNDAFDQIQNLFNEQVQSFTSLMKAYRIAQLEIEGEYNEAIHNDYFEHFTWYRLLQDELNLFPPIVLLVTQAYLFDHLTSLSHLLASNKPIKIVVLNQEHITAPHEQLSWEDASHQFRQEIATLGIAHRNVYTFQSSMLDPTFTYQGLDNCFKSTAPGICHLSVPKENKLSNTSHFLISKAANASRYFPGILYDPAKYSEWGGRFDLSENIQSEEKWPIFTLKANTSDNKDFITEVAFTYADYKAIFPEKTEELMIIPAEYDTEHLIPLSEYLEADEANLYGKIPFIWLIDENQNLHKAAVPNVWVVSCQERLDFWSFLQELGGLNSYHAKMALEQKDQLLEEQKAKMDAEREQINAKAQEEAIAQAAERLVLALLNDENHI
ncbi:hypothetical protein QYS49_36835 [Marivirga salinae]|uniref:Uncharacterized protein n=1 Tax=Marivirga salinarum TaxID=3059078 RepID=A0AA51RDS7_9BACT|nr:hypothetical protein [Marivirga sp. BDSF4-3]WMN11009.1 hypothetical protein QYS49_36835 [Marivirga sp. BDSF4-3]